MARAWLLLAAGAARQHGGNDGYDDEPDQYYSWDETVSNGGRIEVGDRIVVWNAAAGAIGASVVEAIESSAGPKRLSQCPNCGSSGVKERRTMQPRFRCHSCRTQFDEPRTRFEVVRTYRSRHDAAWIPLEGTLPAVELRQLALSPKSQLSIRPLDWNRFSRRIEQQGSVAALVDIDQRQAAEDGHAKILTRARLGQREFRSRLVEEFGFVCAVTGRQPAEVLDAAHLYSYAALGSHHEHGGLLLRRDVHALFDRGLLMVEPSLERVRVAPSVAPFTDYGSLADLRLQVELHPKHLEWLRRHWDQHCHKLAG